MKKLPEEQAKMIFAAYYEEKSHREIAEEEWSTSWHCEISYKTGADKIARQFG